jgi:hypothetical protein
VEKLGRKNIVSMKNYTGKLKNIQGCGSGSGLGIRIWNRESGSKGYKKEGGTIPMLSSTGARFFKVYNKKVFFGSGLS